MQFIVVPTVVPGGYSTRYNGATAWLLVCVGNGDLIGVARNMRLPLTSSYAGSIATWPSIRSPLGNPDAAICANDGLAARVAFGAVAESGAQAANSASMAAEPSPRAARNGITIATSWQRERKVDPAHALSHTTSRGRGRPISGPSDRGDA